MVKTMTKPTLTVDQLITSSEAAKKFGDLRKKAKKLPQFITDNGTVDSVLISYELFEQMYDRLTQLENEEENRLLLQRIERNEQNPSAAKSWKDIRRNPES
ncbi:prevent-host-death family protein [Cohnella sp. CIP 111063]|uniref:prevent-host-death family protein n=1 Tax=unclassified Cohnella TaxID=2636738 RepID=UPI000B8C34DD|nr:MULTISPECIES: prevent-host-death family protein [unclassified Cohnella]OXS60337.1 prevent-host-death family protein [Cohnella sp. CIP 111063]PRX73026.1 antitoxin Phd_YefM of type II toxin-antitoxin system [Cohnella sp. SGD-V74]